MKRTTYGVGGLARARPEIAGLLLAGAAAVGLADDLAAVASGEDAAAVGAGLEFVGHGQDASGEEGKSGDGEELHFEKSLVVRVCLVVWKAGDCVWYCCDGDSGADV